jgi:protein-tyrosine phosphatase
MRVLFVCSGNICRSPMAALCLRARAERGGPPELVVDSAGLLGIEHQPASEPAIAAMREIGLDLAPHRSRGFVEADLARTDLIVAMSGAHLAELRERFPTGRPPCVLLRAFEESEEPAEQAQDLEDPIGMPLEFYRARLAEIVRSVEHLARALTRVDRPGTLGR